MLGQETTYKQHRRLVFSITHELKATKLPFARWRYEDRMYADVAMSGRTLIIDESQCYLSNMTIVRGMCMAELDTSAPIYDEVPIIANPLSPFEVWLSKLAVRLKVG
jgi:hypothetical protein